MTSDFTSKHFTRNMANNMFICVVVLTSIFSDVQCATVNVKGTRTVTLPNSNLQLECSYNLSVSETAQTLTLKKGSTTILTWNFSGTPAPVNPWVYSNDTRGVVTIRLLAANVTKSSGGTYNCIMTSTGTNVRTINSSFVVTIHYKPEITSLPSSVGGIEASTVNVTCNISSSPPGVIVWKKGSSQVGTGNVLSLPNIRRSQDGAYTCNASNAVGTIQKNVIINVYYLDVPQMTLSKRTVAENDTISMICSAKSKPSANITIVGPHKHKSGTNSVNYTFTAGSGDTGAYQCSARSSQITTAKKVSKDLTVLSAPYKVATLGVANVTTDSITVVWSSSFNGGVEQEYIVQYLPLLDSQEEAWTQTTARISDPGRKKKVYARISNIHPSRSYRVRVFSVNMFGQSNYSNVITVTTSDLPTQIPFGVGIVVGAGIVIVIIAVAVGSFILYRRKLKPMKKGTVTTRDLENPAFSGQISETGTGLYSKLGGERAKPPVYDALDGNQPAYQSVDDKQNGNLTEPSAPGLYMNYVPDESDKSRGSTSENKPPTDGGLYENT